MPVSSSISSFENLNLKCDGSIVLENQELKRQCDFMKGRISELEEQSENSNNSCEELKRVLRMKTAEAERLGVLCDEFDEIENDYKQQVSTLIKERDQLKEQLNSLFANGDRYQRAELREKDFDTSLIRSVGNLNLTSDKDKIFMENEELKRRCVILEERIIQFEKMSDEANKAGNTAQNEVYSSHKPVASRNNILSSASKTSFTSNTIDCGTSKDVCDNIEENMGPFPQEQFPASPNYSVGPTFDESIIEVAGTPNRTLRTTIYKGFEKSAKLTESPDTKMNNSRCSQQ
ncbi:hypothetical protein DICVIV_01034 [Dictyocaulus viviparus]|uniref:Uncharacterized protein n=1 Tax=Dictyocaulus viviparus TaxID=29172 RepID=A0A0D8Y9F6_DICVI|nr:hypothetical protein DICVIV_01034 [Dictyocaulus viviparus]